MSKPDSIKQSLIHGRVGAAMLAIVAGVLGLEVAHDPEVPIADQLQVVIPTVVAIISAVLALHSKWRETRKSEK